MKFCHSVMLKKRHNVLPLRGGKLHHFLGKTHRHPPIEHLSAASCGWSGTMVLQLHRSRTEGLGLGTSLCWNYGCNWCTDVTWKKTPKNIIKVSKSIYHPYSSCTTLIIIYNNGNPSSSIWILPMGRCVGDLDPGILRPRPGRHQWQLRAHLPVPGVRWWNTQSSLSRSVTVCGHLWLE